MTDQQRQQQEMMKMMMPMMSIMMLLIFYKAPSGLSLYVMASSIFGIIEQKWIREHIEKYEKAAPLPSGGVAKPRPEDGRGPRKLSWMERLQKMADEARKLESQRAVKGKSRR
jgi:membrane protein insertase Oxa1/YidC/SpoIIIJ